MTLKDIQDVSLYIMKHIHDFCIKNNIKYSLGYGSMIGAVRHNGFIPWDDDMDIIMPRPDYDRFIQLYCDNEEFRLLAPEKQNSLKPYARLCEIKRTKAVVRLPWFEGEVGLWIDIFPIDGVDEIAEKRNVDNQRLIKLNKDLKHKRASMIKLSIHSSLMWNLRVFAHMVVHSHFDKKRLLDEIVFLMKKHSYESSRFCGNLGFTGYIKRECLDKDIFERVILHPFEDAEFFILKEYDKNLRNYYGDYMKLPPVENQIPGHSDAQRFYWKDI